MRAAGSSSVALTDVPGPPTGTVWPLPPNHPGPYLDLFTWALIQSYLRRPAQTWRTTIMAGPLTLLLLCCLSKTVFAGLECDFERPCGWSFQSEPPGSDTNFRVVTGKREAQTNDSLDHTQANPTNYAYFNTSSRHGHNPAMIVSPYYQHTGMKCKLRFRYRLFGMPGAQIMITVQHRRVIDGIEPTQQQFDPEQTPIQVGVIDSKHTFIDSWKKETVDIGAASDPMRIRLECWAGQGVLPTDSSQHSQSHLVTMNNQNTECFIDDIELVGCDEEEWREGVCQSNKSRKYMCHKHGSRKCIDYDQICDMHEDCPGGEDEDASIHNCTSVPMGARCSFERSDSVCPGWTVLTNPTNSNVSWVRVNSTMTRTHASSKDLFFVRDHTYNNASGHFMFLRSGPQALFKSQLISPRFPPTWPGLYNKSSIFYNTCRIRFYYCFKGSIPTVHLRVIPGGGGNTGGKLIWSARGSHKSHSQLKFCTWERVNVDVPRQYREYHILFRGSHLFHNDEFAIDDFSMTPECFIGAESWQSSYIPDVYNFTTCGASGPLGPKFSQCDKAYNNTAIVVNLPSSAANDDKTKKLSRGFQTWVVPYTGQYRVIAYGAAGGWLPNRGDDTINYGARVESIFDWKERDELTLVIGQQGLSPCFNGTKRLVWSPNMRNVDPVDFYKAVGQACELTSNLKAFKKPQLLLGTGGGGATLIAKGDRLLLVAAGGGGVFSVRSRNSKSANGQAEPTNDNSQGSTGSSVVRSELNWTIAGGGGGAVCKQEDCNEPHMRIAGRSWSQLEPLSGGQCPAMHDQHEMFYWQMHGGFGGGGAACGPGAGGGGGYNGGDAGNASSGGGGQSYSVGRNASFESGYQPFDGYLLILPCRLRCPKGGGQCKFMPDGRQVCVCTNTGRIVDNPESDSCIVKVVSTQETTQPEHMAPERDFFLAIVIAVIILLAAIFFVIAYVVYQYRCSHLPKYKYNTHDGVVLRHFPATGSGNSQIEFNPNYEFACSFAELKEIPRNCVVLIKALGQGAFGEVYEGVLSNLPDEPMSLSIAVKTLPEFATEQSQLDFHMEALIMSKFHHQNIVRFIGVCFEKMPRFIVLELLSGGDLKSFLRENRPRWTAPPRLLMIDLLKMALDVARGCQYLEENHFIHRDIAARNCLLTTKESGRVVKIADFGMARDIYRADYYRKGGKAMLPVKWMPPEAFLDGVFTSKTDVWSFGVLLWEIFSMGYMPYPGRGNQEVMQLVTAGGRLESPNGCPAQIYQLMTQCWNTVADERPHFGTIVERVGYCIQDPEMSVSPLPPLVHRMASSASAEPPVTELPSQSAALTRSFSAARNEPTPGPSKAPLGEQMPTKGTGVHVQACEPYRPKCSEPLIPLTSPKPASAGSSASESGPADALLRPSLSSPPGSSSLGPSPNLRPLRQSSSSAKTPTFGAEGDDEVFLTSLGADVMRQSQLL